MARRGFFGRIFDAITGRGRSAPSREPTPDERPERGDRLERAWRDETLSRPGRSYRRHLELFNTIPGIDDEAPEEKEYLWRMYIEYMVSGNSQRNDPNNPWWGIIGLDPRDFNWGEFRVAMGYKRRR